MSFTSTPMPKLMLRTDEDDWSFLFLDAWVRRERGTSTYPCLYPIACRRRAAALPPAPTRVPVHTPRAPSAPGSPLLLAPSLTLPHAISSLQRGSRACFPLFLPVELCRLSSRPPPPRSPLPVELRCPRLSRQGRRRLLYLPVLPGCAGQGVRRLQRKGSRTRRAVPAQLWGLGAQPKVPRGQRLRLNADHTLVFLFLVYVTTSSTRERNTTYRRVFLPWEAVGLK